MRLNRIIEHLQKAGFELAADYLLETSRQLDIGEEHEAVISLASTYWNSIIESVKGKSRKRHHLFARFFAINYFLENTPLTQDSIGEMFNGRDHSTVINSRAKHLNMISTDTSYAEKYASFCKEAAIVLPHKRN